VLRQTATAPPVSLSATCGSSTLLTASEADSTVPHEFAPQRLCRIGRMGPIEFQVFAHTAIR
jgi:hypothetical protein